MVSVDDVKVLKVAVAGPGGTGVTAAEKTDITSRLTNLEASGASGTGGVVVQDEGAPLATVGGVLNFVGAGVTATGTGRAKTVTIPGSAGATVVVKEGGVTRSTASNIDFTDADFDISESPVGTAIITLHGFNNAKPMYAQVVPHVAQGTTETPSTSNTSTYVPAKTLNVVLEAGAYKVSIITSGIFWSDGSGSGGNVRSLIAGTTQTGAVFVSGLDNTTSGISQSKTGVVSDGSTATVIVFQYLSSSAVNAFHNSLPYFLVVAERTA